MDRSSARALYLGCTEQICSSNTSATQGRTCAGLLLDMWLQVTFCRKAKETD